MFIAYRFAYSVSFFCDFSFHWFVNLLTGRQQLLPRLLRLLQPLSTQTSLYRFGILVYWFRANSIVIMLFDTFQLWRSILIISCCHSRFLSYSKPRHSTKSTTAMVSWNMHANHLIILLLLFSSVTMSHFQQTHRAPTHLADDEWGRGGSRDGTTKWSKAWG